MARMLAPCGFRCDRCVAFAGTTRTPEDRERAGAAWRRYWGLRVPSDHIRCHGCLAAEAAGPYFPDPKCKIRSCASEHHVASCGACPGFPCGVISSRMSACDKVVKRFAGTLPAAEFERAIAPYDCRRALENVAARERRRVRRPKR